SIEAPEGTGGDRSDAVRRDQHTGSQADPRRLHRRRAHGDEDLRVEQLRVVEPGTGEAELLGALHHLPGIGRGGEIDAVVHASTFPMAEPVVKSVTDLEMPNEISNRLKELGVLLSHQPMATLLEDLLFGLRYAFEDLIGRERRRDLVVASGEDESRSGNFGKPG